MFLLSDFHLHVTYTEVDPLPESVSGACGLAQGHNCSSQDHTAVYYTSLPSAGTWASFVCCVEIFNQHKDLAHGLCAMDHFLQKAMA